MHAMDWSGGFRRALVLEPKAMDLLKATSARLAAP
jgi:hypothetical protein